MRDLGGDLEIRLDPLSGEVSVCSTRVLSAARVFVGKAPEEVVRQVPMLFSLCGTAQTAASIGAFEQALGLTATGSARLLRAQLVHAETIKEHLWRLLLDWPRVMGSAGQEGQRLVPATAAMAQVMRAFARVRQGLSGSVDPFRLGACTGVETVPETAASAPRAQMAPMPLTNAVLALTALVQEQAFRVTPADWLMQIDGLDALLRWAEQTPTIPAGLVRALMSQGLADCGANAVPPLSGMPLDEFARQLSASEAQAFIAAPQRDGQCHETGPLARAAAHPLLVSLLDQYGNGLLAHLAALLVELARSAATLEAALGAGAQAIACGTGAAAGQQGADAGCAPGAGSELPGEGDIRCGIAQAAAARGLLVHRVLLANARVHQYQILAPTEWNFHPAGVVAQGLTAIAKRGVNARELERRAHLYITAVDPCVEYRLALC